MAGRCDLAVIVNSCSLNESESHHYTPFLPNAVAAPPHSTKAYIESIHRLWVIQEHKTRIVQRACLCGLLF